jgi:dTDP-4-amino-4,6-dideoxygalactose transaminase
MEYLNTHGVYPGVHYKDNTRYDLYKDQYGTCPNAHKISKELITLPIHCNMTDDDVLYVTRIVKSSLKLWY